MQGRYAELNEIKTEITEGFGNIKESGKNKVDISSVKWSKSINKLGGETPTRPQLGRSKMRLEDNIRNDHREMELVLHRG